MGFDVSGFCRACVMILAAVSSPAWGAAADQPAVTEPAAAADERTDAQPVTQEVIENRTRHWSMLLPPGWSLASQATVDAIDDAMNLLAPEKGFRCVAILWMDETRGTAGPHIQVHAVAVDNSLVSLDAMEKSLSGTREAAVARQLEHDAAKGQTSQAEETPPTLDRERFRIVSSGQLIVPPADPGSPARSMRFTSTGMIGKREVTKLIFYAPDTEYAALSPTYDALVDSFAYDAGWGYSPVEPLRRSGLPLGAGGLVVAGLVVISVKLLWRRKKPKPAGPFGL